MEDFLKKSFAIFVNKFRIFDFIHEIEHSAFFRELLRNFCSNAWMILCKKKCRIFCRNPWKIFSKISLDVFLKESRNIFRRNPWKLKDLYVLLVLSLRWILRKLWRNFRMILWGNFKRNPWPNLSKISWKKF